MEFKKLDKSKISEAEANVFKTWGSVDDALDKHLEQRKDSSNFVFYDGPAFANGFPGLHHMVSKNLKDIFCKYQAMNGKRVVRKIGWDTHGLPIENHVEKKLGFTTKKEIEEFGIDNFNKECRASIRLNEDAFENLTNKMGQFIDTKNPYLTYKNEYIETEWWILKKMYDEGYFYEGNKVMPYCPRCGTGLATHEVAQGYEDVTVNSVYVTFKKKDEDVYFLVWTTTPWTLIANVALCVNPNEDYQLVESKGTKFIMAKSLVNKVLGEEVEVLDTFKGTDLEYTEYEQLIPSLTPDKKSFYVTCDNYVTMEDGTGIVHIAPAFGVDDANVVEKYDIGFLNPVGKDGTYTEGLWQGKLVFEADIDIITYLKENNKLFKKQKLVHNYPHCWRCSSPLLYYALPAYYIAVSKMKDKLIEANSKVNWYPSYVGEKRFANWLENARDWNVSRSRYWGSPIPYYTCECGHAHMLGSIEELKELATTPLNEDLDLHKPYIDEIKIKCSKCGKDMTRIPDVLDCWFDSGSMPFAQYHYPFENKELFEEQFPADFICEGIDQTRGWFYTLLVISTFVMGKAPYKNVLVNDLLLDAEGKKMSKSKGNIVEPFTAIEQYGADAIRFYLPYISPVWTPLKFDFDGLKEIYSKYISTFKNAYSFFEMYANADNIDPRDYNIPVENRELIDKWLISKLNKLIKNVNEAYSEYDVNKVTRLIIPFLNDDLSNWYIRSNRRRFWDSELTESKKAVYLTTYEVLVELSKLCAPITPFLTEEIYRNLTNKESVHLEDYPQVNKDLINESVERQMDLVRDICSLGRFAREEENIKVRQPISEIIIPHKDKVIIGSIDDIIKEELNVKNINYVEDMTTYMDYIIKPNFRLVGKMFGPKIKLFQEELTKLTNEEIESIKDRPLLMKIDGEDIEVTEEMVEITIKVKDGYASSSDSNTFVILNTTLTEDLILEGISRELTRKIQSLRKEADFIITDRINVYYYGDEKVEEVINKFNDYIKNETLTDNIIKQDNISEVFDLNGTLVQLSVEKK